MTPYERARDDGAFLARFARAYRGRDEPLDALWWLEHPDEAAPSGAPPPALVLAELRRAMYAPGVDQETAERYRRLRADLEHESEAVRVALGAAAGARATSNAATDTEPPTAAAGTAAAGVPQAGPAVRRRSRRPLILGLAAAAVAFAAGVLAAPGLGQRVVPAPTATATPAETAPIISGSSGSGSSLGIFGEPQRDVDRPPVGIGARLLPQSFRRLQSAPTSGVDIYAAEDSEGDVCLVALSVEARLAATCAPIAAFRSAPLRLSFRADRYRDEWTKTGTQVEVVATWGFLGRFTLGERQVPGE